MNQLKDIISDIRNENCILIIGPDILDFGEKTFFQEMCENLISESGSASIIDCAPQYIFANEELLQLMPTAKETTLLRMMEEFYHKQTDFDPPLKKISQIPFHLIVSLMPDARLQKLFDEQNLNFNYAHYPREGAHPPVDKPAKDKPLIYNLLGDFVDKDAIITFDHLFEFLSGIMGKRELPPTIQETLKRASTFIFLGVHFEKWYVQLLLKIITSEKKENYIVLKDIANNEGCTFVARRHKLDFLQLNPLQFLDALYAECNEQEILKTVRAKYKSKVFISYNKEDIEIVKKIEQRLYGEQIEVIRDDVSSHAGQKVVHFIDTIKDVDCVLLVASKNSLVSRWVGKEIMAAIDNDKKFAPCYVDKSFLDDEFWDRLKENVKHKVDEIGHKIIARGTDSIIDLETDGKEWREFNSNIPVIKNELNKGIAKSIMPEDFEFTISQVIHYILKK